jgi:hypothetical protein
MFLATAAQPKTKSRSTKVEKEPRQPISAWSGLAMSGFFVACVGEPLKRIYKASQEKKRIFLPGCRFGFVFPPPHPNVVSVIN